MTMKWMSSMGSKVSTLCLIAICLFEQQLHRVGESMYSCTLEKPILIHGASTLDYAFGAIFLRLEGQ